MFLFAIITIIIIIIFRIGATIIGTFYLCMTLTHFQGYNLIQNSNIFSLYNCKFVPPHDGIT